MAQLALLCVFLLSYTAYGDSSQRSFEQVAKDLCLEQPLNTYVDNKAYGVGKKLKIVLVDLNQKDPTWVNISGDEMMYAASTSKLSFLYSYFAALNEGIVPWNTSTEMQLKDMIRNSSNAMATQILLKIGKALNGSSPEQQMEKSVNYTNALMMHYQFFDSKNGGLWNAGGYTTVGDFNPDLFRDPILGLSHAASATKLAELFLTLIQGTAFDAETSQKMLEITKYPGLKYKFIKGLAEKYNCKDDNYNSCLEKQGIVTYGKSGMWENWHSDVLYIVKPKSKYLITAMCEGPIELNSTCAAQNKFKAKTNCDTIFERLAARWDNEFQ